MVKRMLPDFDGVDDIKNEVTTLITGWQDGRDRKLTAPQLVEFVKSNAIDTDLTYGAAESVDGVAYTMTIADGPENLAEGMLVVARVLEDCAAYSSTKTLKINDLDAKPIKTSQSVDLLNSEIQNGDTVVFVYQNDEFQLLNSQRKFVSNEVIPVGAGETFTTLNQALVYFEPYRSVDLSEQVGQIDLVMQTGYVQTQLLNYVAMDFKHIVVGSVDSTVPVVLDGSPTTFAFVYFFENCVGFNLTTTFDMADASCDSVARACAIFRNSSMLWDSNTDGRTVGFINYANAGLVVALNSQLTEVNANANRPNTLESNKALTGQAVNIEAGSCVMLGHLQLKSTVRSDLSQELVRVTNSRAALERLDASTSGGYFRIEHSSVVNLRYSDISGSTCTGADLIFVNYACIVGLHASDTSGATAVTTNLYVGNASNVNINDSTTGGSSGDNINVAGGSLCNAGGTTATTNITRNTLDAAGIIFG